jgi:hypothetical protein
MRRRGGEAGCDGARLVRGEIGRAAASVSRRARLVPAVSGRKWKGVKIKRISPCAIAGAIGYDTILPISRKVDSKTKAILFGPYKIYKNFAECDTCFALVDKLLTVYIPKCNGQRIRLNIREGILCGVGGNLCKR